MEEKFELMTTEMKQHLCNVILPFWLRRRDDVNGGFNGYMNYELQDDPKAVKGGILNSRILWLFSSVIRAMNEGQINDSDLQGYTGEDIRKAADHAYEFLRDVIYDREKGGLYWSVTYAGRPYDTTKHTYNQGFGIYGLSAYYEITGNQEALDLANDLFDIIESHCCDAGGYGEAYKRDFSPASNEKLSENGVMAQRTMNTLLHVYEGYAKLLEALKENDADPALIKKVSERMIFQLNIFNEKIYNPEKHRQEVFFDKEYNSLIDLHSYGHDIETAWLIRWGIEVLKTQPAVKDHDQLLADIQDMAVDLTDKILDDCFEGHSLPAEKEGNEVHDHRVWWVQAETVNGFLYEYISSGNEKYLDAALSEWEYIKEKSIDHRKGSEWFWELYADGSPVPDRPIVEEWKCPYHNGRMVLLTLKLFERGYQNDTKDYQAAS
jgi:mannobiose 2-epimerase